MKVAISSALTLLLIVPAVVPAQHAGVIAEIDGIVAAAMEEANIAGVGVGVAFGDDIVVAKGYGLADVENDVPVTASTVFRIGSVTKQFTAAAILLLVERGELSLDDELSTLVPEFKGQGHRITVDRLLNHTSGIKGYTEMPTFWENARLDLTRAEMLELFGSVPFEFAPGEKYQYNNSAYYLLGVIIEEKSGMSYGEFLRKNIFEPLALDETHYLDNAPIVPNRAEGYEVREGVLVNDDPLSMRLPYSAGSLGSSVSDLIKWQRALVDNELLREDSYRKMTTPGRLADGEQLTYGYGLGLAHLDDRLKLAHGGGINGFRCQLSYYPTDKLTVVVLTNTGAANPAPLESAIARVALGIPPRKIVEVSLTTEELRIYAGIYNPGRSPMDVVLDDGRLTVFGQALRPVGDHVFVSSGDPDLEFIFTVLDGEATSVETSRQGQSSKAPRVR